jgi:hypothetical protein
MSPVDPRLGGNSLGVTDPLMAQLVALRMTCADLQRQINDLRAAPSVQTGTASPSASGLLGRDGTPYGRTTGEFWMRFPTGWRGVTLPLT